MSPRNSPRNRRWLLGLYRTGARAGLFGLVAAALVACGSGSSSGSPPSGGGGGGGGTGTSGNFYLLGPTGIDHSNGGNITFAGVASSGTDLTLTAVTPATGTGSTLVQNGTWLSEAQVGQWTPASGSATAIGARFNVYAGTDNRFHLVDLQIVAGASAPTTAVLSTLTPSTVCNSLPTVINDLATPANSLLVFDTPAANNSCGGSLTDGFTVVPLSAGASTAPAAASSIEPVDAVRDANGSITQLLLLVHANQPYVAVSSGTSLASPTKIRDLTGTGNNSGGASRDFQSLAVIPVGSSAVWLYRDGGAVYGVNLATPTAPVLAFLDEDSDVVQGPAIVDGTKAYLALIDQTHPLPGTTPPACCTNQIVRIDASALGNQVGVVLIQELSTGLQLLGIAGNNLFYEFSDGSALKSIDKTSPGTAASIPIVTFASASSSIYAGVPPVVVSGGIYYTVSTPSAANSLQAWFYNGNSAALLGSFSQVLGGVAASPLATTDAGITASDISNVNSNVSPVAPTYSSALVAIMPAGNTAPSIYPAASIFSYDSNGARSANLGTLYKPIADDYDTLAVAPGLLQAGVPALLEVGGNNVASGNYTGHDLYQITPGTANSLIQVTKNLQ